MTRQSTKQQGVSLVEVMLTLAISAMLITTVLAGRNSLRSQAQFSDGIERIKETILSTKSEANTSNSTNTASTGTGKLAGSSYLNLGRSIRFTKGSSQIQTLNILCYANSDLQCTDRLKVDDGTTKTTSLPWNIVYTSYTDATGTHAEPELSIIFARNDTDGSFTGYWTPGGVYDSDNAAGQARSQLFNAANSKPVTLNFESPDGRQATVEVNPATGTVTRTIL